MPTKLIPQKDLALIIGVSDNSLQVYLSHYTLFKFVKYKHKKVNGKRIKFKYFVLTKESINALSDYLAIKRMVNKKIKANAIEKLKKYYTSNDVVENDKENRQTAAEPTENFKALKAKLQAMCRK